MPKLYIIAGCNGAGKTTSSFIVLPELLACTEFVNADNIAAGLSPLNTDSMTIIAGRIMVSRIDHLIQSGADFAFETTLSGRSTMLPIGQATAAGYTIILCYFWLPSAAVAAARVRSRVAKGGHQIPEKVIARRYRRSVTNFIEIYAHVTDRWMVYDTSGKVPVIVAEGEELIKMVHRRETWSLITSTPEIPEPTTPQMSEFARQFTEALQKGVRKLVEYNARLDQTMVYGDKDGNVIHVPAKEVLKNWEEEDRKKAAAK